MSSSTTTATTALAEAVQLRTDLVAEGDAWNVERVERKIATVRGSLDAAVAALRKEHGAAGHAASNALIVVAERLADMGAELNAGRKRIVDWTMPQDGNAAMAAFFLYGSSARRGEVVDLNRLADPNRIAAGTVLRVREA